MLFTTNFNQQNYLLSNAEFVMRAYFSTINVLIFFQRYLATTSSYLPFYYSTMLNLPCELISVLVKLKEY